MQLPMTTTFAETTRPLQRTLSASVACATLALAFLTGGTTPSNAAPSATATLVPVATGLDNPRHMHFGPDGALYVAEAGRGGGPNAPHIVGGDGSTQYYGATGAVTKITPAGSTRIVTGLPSVAAADGSQATGPSDVYTGNGFYVLIGGLSPANRTTLSAAAPLAADFNDLLLVLSPTDSTYWTPFADFAAFEAAHPTNPNDINSDPYSLDVLPGPGNAPFNPDFIVADAGANDVLSVNKADTVALDAFLPNRLVPYMGGVIPMQSVPTCAVAVPNGDIYVGQLTGFPYPPSGANIYVIHPGKQPVILFDNFTNIISMALGPNDVLYVLEIASNGLASPTGPGNGTLYRIDLTQAHPNKQRIVRAGLNFPTAVAVDPNGQVYVTNNGVTAGAGEVDHVVQP